MEIGHWRKSRIFFFEGSDGGDAALWRRCRRRASRRPHGPHREAVFRRESSTRPQLMAHCVPRATRSNPPQTSRSRSQARLDRYRIEAESATFEGTCRMLGAGSVFRLEHEKDRYEGEYLVTRLELHAEQHGVGTALLGRSREQAFLCAFE